MKVYKSNLSDRTLKFAKEIIYLCKELPKNTVDAELAKQLARSGTSIGANYREANDALSRKDFLHRLRISRKEAKETWYWLELIIESKPGFKSKVEPLARESEELVKILSAIIERSK